MENISVNAIPYMGFEDCAKTQKGRCHVCCRKFPLRKTVWKTKVPDQFFIHHIIPRRFGGSDERKNLIYVCRNCHTIAHKSYSDIAITKAVKTNKNYFQDVMDHLRKTLKYK